MYGHSNKITQKTWLHIEQFTKMCPRGFQWPASVSLEEWVVIARLMVCSIGGDREHSCYREWEHAGFSPGKQPERGFTGLTSLLAIVLKNCSDLGQAAQWVNALLLSLTPEYSTWERTDSQFFCPLCSTGECTHAHIHADTMCVYSV